MLDSSTTAKYIKEKNLALITQLPFQALNSFTNVEFTVAQKSDQGTTRKRPYPFSGVLFWFFFAQTKKNK
jgi:hypothetical protein